MDKRPPAKHRGAAKGGPRSGQPATVLKWPSSNFADVISRASDNAAMPDRSERPEVRGQYSRKQSSYRQMSATTAEASAAPQSQLPQSYVGIARTLTHDHVTPCRSRFYRPEPIQPSSPVQPSCQYVRALSGLLSLFQNAENNLCRVVTQRRTAGPHRLGSLSRRATSDHDGSECAFDQWCLQSTSNARALAYEPFEFVLRPVLHCFDGLGRSVALPASSARCPGYRPARQFPAGRGRSLSNSPDDATCGSGSDRPCPSAGQPLPRS